MTIEAGAEGADETAHEAVVSSVEKTDADYERMARDLGWVPEEEFKGENKPKRFKDAKEFLADSSPQLKKALETIEKRMEERLQRIEQTNRRTVERLTELKDAEIAALRQARKDAIKAGDADEAERLSDIIDEKKSEKPDKEDIDVNKAFQKRNPWYGVDEELTAVAIGISQDVVTKSPNMQPEDMYAEVERRIKRTAAYKAYIADTPAANAHAAVDGGSDSAPPSKASPLAKLPPEARAQAKQDMARFPKIYPTEAAWVKAYEGR